MHPPLVNLESVEALPISMEQDQYTLAYHFVPLNGKRNRLVIMHYGHTCTIDDGVDSNSFGYVRTINARLSNGFGVLIFNMPKESPANREVPDPGDCSGAHEDLFNLTVVGSPLKFFIEPVIVGINYFSQQSAVRYTDFNMVGLSGGGWTTTLAAAVDTRIKLSFPTAGTVPMYMRIEPYQSHDIEQFVASFYGATNPATTGVAGYLDLYLLGSRGTGRGQVQVLNRHDSSCFGEAQHNAAEFGMAFEPALRIYESRLKTMAPDAPGFFRVVLDEAAPSHMISDNAINNVYLPALFANNVSTLTTTLRSNWPYSMCIDLPDYGRPPQNGDPVQVYGCDPSVNQQFLFDVDGRVSNNGLCLDVPDFGRPARNGDQLQVWACHGGLNQKFDLLADGKFSRTDRSRSAPWAACASTSRTSEDRRATATSCKCGNAAATAISASTSVDRVSPRDFTAA